MIKYFNAKMCGLAVICLLLVGCAVQLHYDNREVSTDPTKLAAQVADAESELEGLTNELEEAKMSRDAIVEASKTASHWDSPMQKVSNANINVQFAASRVTSAKQWLAKVKAAQKELENVQE